MERRRFLASLAAAGGLAGCLAPAATRRGTGDTATPRQPEGPLGRLGFPPDICEEERKANPGIDVITDPATAGGWRAHAVDERYRLGDGPGLAPDATVIGLADGGTARAYPLSVLWYHEAVNDRLAGRPVLVTYCPLCRSGMVADRTLDGTVATFDATGLLWAAPQLQEAVAEREGRTFGARRRGGEAPLRHSGNVVLVDDVSGSYWSQILATAICGPMARRTLDIVPSTVTTWREWRRDHPDTAVLLPPPHSGTVRGGTVANG